MRKDYGRPDKPAGRKPEVDFSGEKRSNATHQSITDPEARLYKKGEYTEAKLRYITHALAENRHGLIADVETTQATGTTEVEAAQQMVEKAFGWIKTPGDFRKTRHKALAKVSGQGLLALLLTT